MAFQMGLSALPSKTGFRVQGILVVWGLGFRVFWGLGFRVLWGFGVLDHSFRVIGCRFSGLWLK